jgi:hypothetical protein
MSTQNTNNSKTSKVAVKNYWNEEKKENIYVKVSVNDEGKYFVKSITLAGLEGFSGMTEEFDDVVFDSEAEAFDEVEKVWSERTENESGFTRDFYKENEISEIYYEEVE